MSADPVREAVKGAAASIARGGGEQPALFELPCLDPSGEIAQAQARSTKGGRPKGAQNLSTRQLRDFLLGRMGGKTPQEQVAQWASLGPEGLKRALAVDTATAFSLWLRMQEWLGRYFMAPMVPVDAEGNPAPTFVVSIGGSTGITTATGEVKAPWTYLEQDQQVIDGELAQSKEEPEAE